MAKKDAPTEKSGIYSIVNLRNGKRYVGSAARFSQRWYLHRRTLESGDHHSSKLQRAWTKYGVNAFDFLIIEIVDDRSDLLRREQHYLDILQPEYNISLTAGSRLGLVNSETHRKRISAALNTPESQAKLSARWKGKKQSDEHRAARGEGMRGNKNGLGNKITPEQRAAMNAGRAAKIASGELDIRNPKFSPAAIEKCRQAAIAQHAARRAAKALANGVAPADLVN